jgi:two-component system response regulator NreC
MASPIRIILADDHAIMREGLTALLADEPDLQVVGEAGTGREALSLIHRHQPDLALLDITMPDMTGLEVTAQVTAALSEVKVLILTMHEEEAFFFEALQAGASGYILKGVHSEELINAIRAVYTGGIYLPPQLVSSLVQDYLSRHPQLPPDDPLTPREVEILALLAQGLSNRDIAEQLMLSQNTVKTHRLHIYQKLDLHDRAELITYALRHGLLA